MVKAGKAAFVHVGSGLKEMVDREVDP